MASAYNLASAFIGVGVKGLGGIASAFGKIKDMALGALSSIGRMMAKVGAIAGIGGAIGIIKLASDAHELDNLFAQVFKGGTAAAEKFARDMAMKLGRSTIAIKKEMAGFQDMFVPLGFARKDAAKLSKAMTKMSEDIASAKNKNGVRVMERLKSGILGNHRVALLGLGPAITQSRLKMELARLGMNDSVKSAIPLEKALARIVLIHRQTRDSHGDAADTAESFENRLKGLSGAVIDVASMIGRALIPALANLAKQLTDLIRKHEPWITEWAQFFGKVGSLLTKRWDLIWKLLETSTAFGLTRIGDLITSFFSQLPYVIIEAMGRGTITIVTGFVQLIHKTLVATNKMIMGEVLSYANFYGKLFENLKGVMQGKKWDPMFTPITNASDGALASITKAWDKFFEGALGRGKGFDFGMSEASKKQFEELKSVMEEIRKLSEAEKLFENPYRPEQDVNVDNMEVDKLKIPSGFMDVTQANEKLQAYFLKGNNVQEKMAAGIEQGNELQQQAVNALNNIEANIGGGEGGVGGAVATQ